MKRKAQRAQIGDVAAISTGVTVRDAATQLQPTGEVRVISASNVEAGPTLNLVGVRFILRESVPQDSLLAPNDLIFRNRGSRFEAIAPPDDSIPSVATSMLVLRVDPSKAAPGYLAWAINVHPVVRNTIQTKANVGSTIPSINSSELAEIEIPLPSLKIQHRIATIHELQGRVRQLEQRLNELRDQYLTAALVRLVERSPAQGD
ncbi:MAG: hypothetical protein HPKKFMNG_02036 [Planctomycetes bacterium]|nr:hypothetical protein [Planctomycetota bacterium]